MSSNSVAATFDLSRMTKTRSALASGLKLARLAFSASSVLVPPVVRRVGPERPDHRDRVGGQVLLLRGASGLGVAAGRGIAYAEQVGCAQNVRHDALRIPFVLVNGFAKRPRRAWGELQIEFVTKPHSGCDFA